MSRLIAAVAVLATSALGACGSGSPAGDTTTATGEVTPTSTSPSPSSATALDPCSLLTKEQVGEVTGFTPIEADAGTTGYFGVDDAPACYWGLEGGTTVVHIYLGSMSEEEFLAGRSDIDEAMGDPGVGDASYFNANAFYNQIYVLSGQHAAFIDISKYDADPDKARQQSTRLAELVVDALPGSAASKANGLN